jgi:hypothetical protein
LGRKVAAWHLLDEVYAELIARADEELSSGAAKSGCVVPMIAAVAAKPTHQQKKQAPNHGPRARVVDELLEKAFTVYGTDGRLSQQWRHDASPDQ